MARSVKYGEYRYGIYAVGKRALRVRPGFSGRLAARFGATASKKNIFK